jgi:hypothetical protein
MNLKTQQVDYMQAFPQAALEDPVFIRIPHGWYLKSNIMIIALSTTETEFIAISSSTHNLIPLQGVLNAALSVSLFIMQKTKS